MDHHRRSCASHPVHLDLYPGTLVSLRLDYHRNPYPILPVQGRDRQGFRASHHTDRNLSHQQAGSLVFPVHKIGLDRTNYPFNSRDGFRMADVEKTGGPVRLQSARILLVGGDLARTSFLYRARKQHSHLRQSRYRNLPCPSNPLD